MAERNWTSPQWDAITAKGGSLLVSAAAGSGKTAVLVERAIRLICDANDPMPADRLLVVTFSNAAAAEMKQRMHARLSGMIAENPQNIHLQRQQALLQSAQISTIHAFCLELIRQNFQHLDISPDFILSDENEIQMMEQDCARDCIEDFYEQDDDGSFADLVELLSGGRDDQGLIDTMLRIYRFSRSHPFHESWLGEKRSMYDASLPVSQTVWGQAVLRHVQDTLSYCRSTMLEAVRLIQGDASLEKGYLAAFQSDLAQIDHCLGLAERAEWDKLVQAVTGFVFERLGRVSGDGTDRERVKASRDRSKKAIQGLGKKYMNATEAEFQRDMEDLRPKVNLLFDLVIAFGRSLWQIKREKRRLDFSDLEHLALVLLVEQEGNGYRRTQRAVEIAARYDMVMVDEYQDSNEVQDLIFTSVSDQQRNLFMVGDVKQSIYSFRQAMPEIFLRKKEVFFPYGGGQFPAKIILDTNFRSREQVTGGINYLFALLMSERVGELRYTKEESLKCGAVYPEYSGASPELLLLEAGEDGPWQETPEPDAVAARIQQLLQEEYLVTEGGELRPVRPGDICILLRSPRNRASQYVKALEYLGIPARAETSGGYLQTREVSMVSSLLKALDNPLLDIELVAALLSPLFGFSDDDIAQIRLTQRGVPFYNALCLSAEQGDTRSVAFLETFRHLRARAAVLPADRLLLELYDRTNALTVVRCMMLGENRVSNLQLLVEYAAKWHAMGYKRLGGFIGFLNRLEDRGGDLTPAGNGMLDGSNAVKIMSIHKSKGLEFPVVILADTFRQFNKVDLRARTLLHSTYGFACVRRDEQNMCQFPTVPMQAIRLESERSLLSEELRILYVALTRAREKMIVSGYYKHNLEKHLNDLHTVLQQGAVPPFAVGDTACYADWIIMALLHHKSGAPMRERAGIDMAQELDDANPWLVQIRQVPPAREQQWNETEIQRTAAADRSILLHLKEQANWQYLWKSQVTIPAKLAVSAVSKGTADPSLRFAARPKFMQGQGLTGAERGNALHKFMQFADYSNARTDLEGEINRMQDMEFLSRAEVESLSRKRLANFFCSSLANRIFASTKVLRELKFTAECGKAMLGEQIQGLDDESRIVLQGVADCVFFEENHAVIVDYKTDAVREPTLLLQRYATQLELYRAILQESLEVAHIQCLLYSFHLNKEIEVP